MFLLEFRRPHHTTAHHWNGSQMQFYHFFDSLFVWWIESPQFGGLKVLKIGPINYHVD